jgi:membrane-associated progesterone receptor component
MAWGEAAQERARRRVEQVRRAVAPGTCVPRCECARCGGARGPLVPSGAGAGVAAVGVAAERVWTLEELRGYDGAAGKPVMLAVKGIVFDVSAGRGFYGKGGGYEMLASRDASRALAKMSMAIADVDNPSVDDLDEHQRLSLDSWGWSASRPSTRSLAAWRDWLQASRQPGGQAHSETRWRG